jgi:hypothetical protein
MDKKKHGGRRAGAGRKSIPANDKKQAYTTKLRPDQIGWLRTQYKAASLIEQLIDEAMERYRDK